MAAYLWCGTGGGGRQGFQMNLMKLFFPSDIEIPLPVKRRVS